MEAIAYQSISQSCRNHLYPRKSVKRSSKTYFHEMLSSKARTQKSRTLAQNQRHERLAQNHRRHRPCPRPARNSDEELVERLISVASAPDRQCPHLPPRPPRRPPIHDLGVQKGWSVAYGKNTSPAPNSWLSAKLAPYRTVASWYLWRASNARLRRRSKIRAPKPNQNRIKPNLAAARPQNPPPNPGPGRSAEFQSLPHCLLHHPEQRRHSGQQNSTLQSHRHPVHPPKLR